MNKRFHPPLPDTPEGFLLRAYKSEKFGLSYYVVKLYAVGKILKFTVPIYVQFEVGSAPEDNPALLNTRVYASAVKLSQLAASQREAN